MAKYVSLIGEIKLSFLEARMPIFLQHLIFQQATEIFLRADQRIKLAKTNPNNAKDYPEVKNGFVPDT